jgi:hypothetical protein
VAEAGAKDSSEATVTYASGRTLVLREWAFEYLFIESEHPKGPGTYFSTRKSDQALFVRVPVKNKSEGVLDRRIDPKDLKALVFGWEFGQNTPSLKKIVVETNGREVIVFRDRTSSDHKGWVSGDLMPATALLSKARYVFGSGYCPCIVLKGRTVDGNSFEEVISAMEAGAARTPDEVISRIAFRWDINRAGGAESGFAETLRLVPQIPACASPG